MQRTSILWASPVDRSSLLYVYDTWRKYSLFHLVSCNFVSDSFYYIGLSNYKMSGIIHRCVRSVGILLYFDFKPKANWCTSISDTWCLILMSLKDLRRCHCILRKYFYFHISAGYNIFSLWNLGLKNLEIKCLELSLIKERNFNRDWHCYVICLRWFTLDLIITKIFSAKLIWAKSLVTESRR